MMNIVIRVDSEASVIGTGHVMRCLSLADHISKKGFKIHFICRCLKGHLAELIKSKGYRVSLLPYANIKNKFSKNKKIFKKSFQLKEATQMLRFVKNKKIDLIIIDHYFLDNKFEEKIRHYFSKIFVIDDLANRLHYCDFLLDQNYFRHSQTRYRDLLKKKCRTFFGPKYALVRKEFKNFRRINLRRIEKKNFFCLKKILVFMGGNDPKREIFKALKGINGINQSVKMIHIVVGSSFEFKNKLRKEIKSMKFPCKLHIQTNKMEKILSEVDLAITSGGTVTWERCVLGVPSIVTVLAENQKENAKRLEKIGAQIVLGNSDDVSENTYIKKINSLSLKKLKSLSRTCSKICDGKGVNRIVNKILANHAQR